MPLELSVGHATQTGKRERNEDFCGVVTPEGSEFAARGALLAVADGVSGSGEGRAAAEYAVRGVLADYYATPETWEVPLAIDRVLSAFMFHHLLNPEEKTKTLLEARRVLVPGGSLHLLDFGGTTGRSQGYLERFLHRTERLQDNAGERVVSLMREAGFEDPAEVAHRVMTIFGRVTYYRASLPRQQ